ncbi:MAG: hypothetical protein EHM42_08905 [Planctomycetaceae bacterium]|nr:MAG: hypothetical protein EHM42_08905 [Planctomycetaceae bacterium]
MNACETLISAANAAPSGDNLQPWSFQIDLAAGTIRIAVDETRDQSPMNAGQRMARIAVGAAVENILRATEFSGVAAELTRIDESGGCEIAIRDLENASVQVDPVIQRRATNRRVYEGGAVSEEVAARLRDGTHSSEGVRTVWIHDRRQIESLAGLISRADSLMFGNPTLRKSFLANVRFDLPADDPGSHGLSLASLELQGADRIAFRILPRIPPWLFRLAGIARKFAVKSKRLVDSSSGLCAVIAPDNTRATDVRVGRSFERAWLALTGEGLAAQPLMSIAVLAGICEFGPAPLQESLRDEVSPLIESMQSIIAGPPAGRIAALLRFGKAADPSSRAGRLSPHITVAPH